MIKDRYINPLTDFGFKKLFGEAANKELLIHFLNQLLPEKHQVEDLEYLPSERLPSSFLDRKVIFDIYCTSSRGEQFIIELQRSKQNHFIDRSIFYSTFPIQEQSERGDWNFKLWPIYTICILDFKINQPNPNNRVIRYVQLKDQDKELFFEDLTYIYIELPNFTKTLDELEDLQDKWLYLFRYLAKLEDRPAALQERIFTRLFRAAEIASYSIEERQNYEVSLKKHRDIKNAIDTALEKGRAEGLEEGLELGREEGLKEGEERGLEKGLEQGKEEGALAAKKAMAKQMQAANLPLDQITQITGCALEQIKNWLKD